MCLGELESYVADAALDGGRRWSPWMKLRFDGDFYTCLLGYESAWECN